MLKNLSQLECVIDGKTVRMQCDCDTPLPICKEALFQFQKFIGKIEDSAKAAQEAAEKEKQDLEEKVEIKEPQEENVQKEESP